MTEQFKYQEPRYLRTSEELLDPKVGAVEIGSLEAGIFEDVQRRMKEVAQERAIQQPRMIVDLVFKEGKQSELGSPGQPYPITEEEWERFVEDIPEYCGDRVPKVYVVDGSKYTAGI